MQIWRQAGKLLRDAFGKVIRCGACPCGVATFCGGGSCSIPEQLFATLVINGVTIATSISLPNIGGTSWSTTSFDTGLGHFVYTGYWCTYGVRITLGCSTFGGPYLIFGDVEILADPDNALSQLFTDSYIEGETYVTFSCSPFLMTVTSKPNTFDIPRDPSLGAGPWCSLAAAAPGTITWTLTVTE